MIWAAYDVDAGNCCSADGALLTRTPRADTAKHRPHRYRRRSGSGSWCARACTTRRRTGAASRRLFAVGGGAMKRYCCRQWRGSAPARPTAHTRPRCTRPGTRRCCLRALPVNAARRRNRAHWAMTGVSVKLAIEQGASPNRPGGQYPLHGAAESAMPISYLPVRPGVRVRNKAGRRPVDWAARASEVVKLLSMK